MPSSLIQPIDVIQENRQETAALLDGPFQNLARGYPLALSYRIRNADRKAENRPEFYAYADIEAKGQHEAILR